MRIVLLGAPGAGKETQAVRLSVRYGISLISMPELLKQLLREKGDLSVRLASALEQGLQLPDELLFLALQSRLARQDVGAGFLLVDFPRTVGQAQTLDQLLGDMQAPIDLVLRMEGDQDHFMERLEGRETCRDCGAVFNLFANPPRVEGVCDRCGGVVRQPVEYNREAVSSRMRIYENQSAPLLEYYIREGRLWRIRGDVGMDAVFQRLCLAIDEGLPASDEAVADATVGLPPGREPAMPHSPVVRSVGARLPKDVSGEAPSATKPAHRKKATSRRKAPVMKQANAKRAAAVKKRIVSKKKAATGKQTTTKKQAAVKKRVAGRKQVVSNKKQAAANRTTVTGKKTAAAKAVSPAEKRAVRTGATVAKKAPTRKATDNRKIVATKKSVPPEKSAPKKKAATRGPVSGSRTRVKKRPPISG